MVREEVEIMTRWLLKGKDKTEDLSWDTPLCRALDILPSDS